MVTHALDRPPRRPPHRIRAWPHGQCRRLALKPEPVEGAAGFRYGSRVMGQRARHTNGQIHRCRYHKTCEETDEHQGARLDGRRCGDDLVGRHTSRYDFPYLRDHCPCALCNDEREKKSKAGPRAPLLPMYKPRVTAKSANAVGNYALQIQFSDSHATGIFSFEHLREICPCEACARDFRSAAAETTA